jgi:hypothetical protein
MFPQSLKLFVLLAVGVTFLPSLADAMPPSGRRGWSISKINSNRRLNGGRVKIPPGNQRLTVRSPQAAKRKARAATPAPATPAPAIPAPVQVPAAIYWSTIDIASTFQQQQIQLVPLQGQ